MTFFAFLREKNLTLTEFRQLYDILYATIITNWNTGRGKKSSFKPMDVLFMTPWS